MKIAIIGSGVAGLTSAYLLSKDHQITIIEKADRIGGHAHTIFVPQEIGDPVPVDNGFMVFNPPHYPNFVALLKELGVTSAKTDMSFSVEIANEIGYRGVVPLGLFANRSNLYSWKFLKFLIDITKFRRQAKKFLASNQSTDITLSEFTKKHSYCSEVSDWFLYPMLSAIWSIHDVEKVGDFPALATFRFMDNHRLLNNYGPTWRTIPGGSVRYVSKIESFIKKHGAVIHTNTSITKIIRKKNSVHISSGGETQVFDYVLFATHANVTRKLLTDATDDELFALSKFSYSKNSTVLHGDTGQVSTNKRLLSSWNYVHYIDTASGKTKAVFTYCMNKLQHINGSIPMFVTLNPTSAIPKHKIYATELYEHPQYSLDALEGQRLITELQGSRNTFYAGAHLGYGFHEDGVVSAINAVHFLGVKPIWHQK